VAAELRRALGQKGGNPFLHISGSGHLRQPLGLQLHLLGKCSVRRAVKQTFESFVSPRGTLSQFRNASRIAAWILAHVIHAARWITLSASNDSLIQRMSDPRLPRGCFIRNTWLECPTSRDEIIRKIAEALGR
jgi:hypothetical protein